MRDELKIPFSNTEIDDAIKGLSNEKSSRPDGFNNEFIKSSWNIIGADIEKVIKDFYDGNICLESINSSYINLTPKIDTH
jgi:hypothetical protein